jgi:hypothetical protein
MIPNDYRSTQYLWLLEDKTRFVGQQGKIKVVPLPN